MFPPDLELCEHAPIRIRIQGPELPGTRLRMRTRVKEAQAGGRGGRVPRPQQPPPLLLPHLPAVASSTLQPQWPQPLLLPHLPAAASRRARKPAR